MKKVVHDLVNIAIKTLYYLATSAKTYQRYNMVSWTQQLDEPYVL